MPIIERSFDYSIKDYEKLMETSINKSHADSLSRKVPQYAARIRSASSIYALIQVCDLPEEVINSFILEGIVNLMLDYMIYTGVPEDKLMKLLRGDSYIVNDQTKISIDIVAGLMEQKIDPIQSCIDRIKSSLTQGLLDPHLHPKDNFPKIVSAIFNKTAGLAGWRFSNEVIQKINDYQRIPPASWLVRMRG